MFRHTLCHLQCEVGKLHNIKNATAQTQSSNQLVHGDLFSFKSPIPTLLMRMRMSVSISTSYHNRIIPNSSFCYVNSEVKNNTKIIRPKPNLLNRDFKILCLQKMHKPRKLTGYVPFFLRIIFITLTRSNCIFIIFVVRLRLDTCKHMSIVFHIVICIFKNYLPLLVKASSKSFEWQRMPLINCTLLDTD